MHIRHTYQQLDPFFFSHSKPKGFNRPRLFLWNEDLSNDLNLSEALKSDPQVQADVFSGSQLPAEFEPVALGYAGHQFGHFVPQLGDGRAHLLGEVETNQGQWMDLQLKGSGRTPYSRNGDGLCAMGPALREFLMGEAMHALGVPTTRSLAVVLTGEPVFRQRALPGAVVTRVAASHIRVGTFEYAASQGHAKGLSELCSYTIMRHFEHIPADAPDTPIRLFEAVMDRQIRLVSEWMRVGFIHGVMNTDNTALSGETIDFGPCAMLGDYHPKTVYSSIDHYGRYAFGNQSRILKWNLARLAESLLPLVHENRQKGISAIEDIFNQYDRRFNEAYIQMMGRKIGIDSGPSHALVETLLQQMQDRAMDYTQTFHRLTQATESEWIFNELKTELGSWMDQWKDRLSSLDEGRQIMAKANPLVIPRNHHMERVLSECEHQMSPEPAIKFLQVIKSPYHDSADTPLYQDTPFDKDRNYKTFCGT